MHTFEMVEIGEDKSATKITLTGEIILEVVSEITPKIKQALEEYNEITLVMQDIDAIDIAFLQLVISLERTAKAEGKKIHKKIEIPETFEDLLSKTGFGGLV